jgi:hypothetical protein
MYKAATRRVRECWDPQFLQNSSSIPHKHQTSYDRILSTCLDIVHRLQKHTASRYYALVLLEYHFRPGYRDQKSTYILAFCQSKKRVSQLNRRSEPMEARNVVFLACVSSSIRPMLITAGIRSSRWQQSSWQNCFS